MVPTELDKRIKETMEQRTIPPSGDSWDKVSGQLATVPVIRRRRINGYGWAAALAGLLIAGIYLVPKHPEAIPVVVEDTLPGQKAQPVVPAAAAGLPPNETGVEIFKEPVAGIAAVQNTTSEKVSDRRGETDFIDTVNKEVGRTEISSGNAASEYAVADDYIEVKVAEVAARVAALEASDGEVTEAEVEQLLLAAQEEIVRNNHPPDIHTVDAMALLSEVESDLDRTFRDQIFEKLKTGYEKVRTAVADRNN